MHENPLNHQAALLKWLRTCYCSSQLTHHWISLQTSDCNIRQHPISHPLDVLPTPNRASSRMLLWHWRIERHTAKSMFGEYPYFILIETIQTFILTHSMRCRDYTTKRVAIGGSAYFTFSSRRMRLHVPLMHADISADPPPLTQNTICRPCCPDAMPCTMVTTYRQLQLNFLKS